MLGGGGKGMGWGTGGANMLRTIVGRAAVSKNPTAAFQEPLSSSTSATRRHNNTNINSYLHVPSSSSGSSSLGSYSSTSGVPITADSGSPSPAFSAGPPCFDDFEWVPRREGDSMQPRDFVLGPVPSFSEVQNAVSALQRVAGVSSSRELIRDKSSYNADKEIGYQVPSPGTSSMHRVRSVGSELDWIEPSMQLYNARANGPYVTNSVSDAFHLLQTDPTIQEMVTSLSSDEAVWNAILNNEMVRELRQSIYAAPEDSSSTSFDENSDENFDKSSETTSVVKRIFDKTKAKMLELFDKIAKLVDQLFRQPPDDYETTKTAGLFDERLRIAMVLSVMVLLIVAVTRAQTA